MVVCETSTTLHKILILRIEGFLREPLIEVPLPKGGVQRMTDAHIMSVHNRIIQAAATELGTHQRGCVLCQQGSAALPTRGEIAIT